MIKNRDIIHFSLDDYWISDPHSRHHLINQFHKNNNRIFWINSFGMRVPKISKRGGLRKISRKLLSFLKFIKRVHSNFLVLSPIAVPIFGSGKVSEINESFLLLQIKRLIKRYRIRKPILFVSSPMFPKVIREIKKDSVIYYYSDSYVHYREIRQKEKIADLDNMTLDLADYVFCASKAIFNQVSKKAKDVFYLPHAVDFDHFNGILEIASDMPWDMKNIKRPIVGYFGSLTDSNDIDLIHYFAVNRPQYSIVLIGRPSHEYEQLGRLPNVYLLGKKKYQELPLYGQYFDVCFMAWKMTEWIKNCSPLKTMEYLALGKPVVAIPIDELLHTYEGVVTIAYGKEDFLKKIDWSLENDSFEKRERRIKFVKYQTWEKRFAEMVDIIEQRGPVARVASP